MRAWIAGLMLLAMAPAYAAAQDAPAPPNGADARRAELRAAIKDGLQHAVHGPADLALAGMAHIKVPPHSVWLPGEYGRRVLRAWGNNVGAETLGMFVGENGKHDWDAIVSVTQEGFVKDDERKALNPDKILAELREGQAEANKGLIERGFPGLELTGWLQNPAYDARTHRLVWALLVEDTESTDADATVNYNTRSLGRGGYISVNLLTSRANFAADRPIADTLLSGFSYDAGKGYQDFNASTDHVAEYGLAALIGVVALKKLGILALGAAFVLKFAKAGALIVVAMSAAVRRLFRRKKQPDVPV